MGADTLAVMAYHRLNSIFDWYWGSFVTPLIYMHWIETAFLQKEVNKWAKVNKDTGIRVA